MENLRIINADYRITAPSVYNGKIEIWQDIRKHIEEILDKTYPQDSFDRWILGKWLDNVNNLMKI